MKKVLAVLLALAMVLSLCACGEKKEEASEGPVTLTLALRAGAYADAIKSCLADFEAANNVKCEVLELSEDDLHTKVALDATNSTGAYDLCMVDGSWMAEYTANGVLANLSELGYKFDSDVIEATTAISYGPDGNIYLAPYYGNVTVLLFNKALVEAAGYTAETIDNLDDVLKICQNSQKNGKIGFVYRGDTENNAVVDFLSILLSYGGWVVDGNNKPTVNTPEFKEALNYYLELIKTGQAAVKDDLIAGINNDTATMAVGWPGWHKAAEEPNSDYCALTGKAHADSKAYKANVYGIWTIGVTANSANKELTEKLVEYLMDPEVQKGTIAAGGVPCRFSCLQDPEILKEHPEFDVVCKALDGGMYRPVIEEWTEFYTILGTELGNVFNGVKTVDAGLADAQAQLDVLMN